MDSTRTGDGLVVDCLPVCMRPFPFPAPQETKSPCSEDDSSRDSGTHGVCVESGKDHAVTGLGFKLCFVEEES